MIVLVVNIMRLFRHFQTTLNGKRPNTNLPAGHKHLTMGVYAVARTVPSIITLNVYAHPNDIEACVVCLVFFLRSVSECLGLIDKVTGSPSSISSLTTETKLS